VHRAVQTSALPELEFNYSIDKATGQIQIRFRQMGDEVVPVDIWLEAQAGPKKKDGRLVQIRTREQLVQWQPRIKAKRLAVDPLKTSLTRSLRRDRGLSIEATASE
jgi:hypothetical protein